MLAMSGHGMLKYFRPITHKKDAPEEKDPPEGKELSNLSWPYLSKAGYTIDIKRRRRAG